MTNQDKERLEALLHYVESDGRVCPLPMPWSELHQMLPNLRRLPSGGCIPPNPLILAAWSDPPSAKRSRLREHILYAADHGALDKVDIFLRGLPDEQWFKENPLTQPVEKPMRFSIMPRLRNPRTGTTVYPKFNPDGSIMHPEIIKAMLDSPAEQSAERKQKLQKLLQLANTIAKQSLNSDETHPTSDTTESENRKY